MQNEKFGISPLYEAIRLLIAAGYQVNTVHDEILISEDKKMSVPTILKPKADLWLFTNQITHIKTVDVPNETYAIKVYFSSTDCNRNTHGEPSVLLTGESAKWLMETLDKNSWGRPAVYQGFEHPTDPRSDEDRLADAQDEIDR